MIALLIGMIALLISMIALLISMIALLIILIVLLIISMTAHHLDCSCLLGPLNFKHGMPRAVWTTRTDARDGARVVCLVDRYCLNLHRARIPASQGATGRARQREGGGGGASVSRDTLEHHVEILIFIRSVMPIL